MTAIFNYKYSYSGFVRRQYTYTVLHLYITVAAVKGWYILSPWSIVAPPLMKGLKALLLTSGCQICIYPDKLELFWLNEGDFYII